MLVERWSSCHHRVWTSSKSTGSPCLASSSTTAWRHLITWLSCWGHVPSYCTLLRVLRSHGLPQQSLKDVFRATVESKIQYAAPAWSGLCTAGDRVQLNAFLRRCMKLGNGYRERDAPSIEEIFAMSDDQLFSRINSNSLHVLQQFMPDRPRLNYSHRARPHNKTLIAKTAQLNDQDFIIRSIYKDLYWPHFIYWLLHLFYYCTHGCVCQLDIKENDEWMNVTLCIVAKRCILEQKLLARAYRKSYMRNQLVPKWMTLTFVRGRIRVTSTTALHLTLNISETVNRDRGLVPKDHQ